MSLQLRFACMLAVISCARSSDRDSTDAAKTTASSTVSRIPSCGEHVIRADGVGKLKLGMPADSVKAACHVAFDTVRPGPEGMSQRVMLVAFPPAAVEAEIVNDSVWRLDITSPGITTADSIGVGTPLREMLKRGDLRGLIGEGIFVLIFRDRCGLSFVLRGGIPPGRPRAWSKKELSTLSPDLPVERIMVYKCVGGGHTW